MLTVSVAGYGGGSGYGNGDSDVNRSGSCTGNGNGNGIGNAGLLGDVLDRVCSSSFAAGSIIGWLSSWLFVVIDSLFCSLFVWV